jgi:hypothetical protein
MGLEGHSVAKLRWRLAASAWRQMPTQCQLSIPNSPLGWCEASASLPTTFGTVTASLRGGAIAPVPVVAHRVAKGNATIYPHVPGRGGAGKTIITTRTPYKFPLTFP